MGAYPQVTTACWWLGEALQQHDAIMRRTYVSQASNAVWHLDGLHKLIQYGFVIHGTVDGHDHVVSEYALDDLLPIDTCAGCWVTCKYKQQCRHCPVTFPQLGF